MNRFAYVSFEHSIVTATRLHCDGHWPVAYLRALLALEGASIPPDAQVCWRVKPFVAYISSPSFDVALSPVRAPRA
jgi:hypothetical protein